MGTVQGLSFVVPAYNEEKSIVDTVDRLRRTLSQLGMPFEIVVVNDGSTDSTGDIAKTFDDVTVLSHPVNIGYGNSLKDGIQRARYEWIGIVDADGSYPIEDIPLLVREMEQGFDMVVGTRSNIREIDGLAKRIFRWFFKKTVQLLNDSRIEDPNSGFRIFKRDIVMKLSPFLCGTFSFTTSLTILTTGLYYFVKFVPVTYAQREGNSKVRHFRDSIRTLLYIMQGIIFFNPIKFFLLLGFWNVIFVCIPAMTIAMMQHPVFSLYYMIFGTTLTLMIGLGGLGDIIRIAADRRNNGTLS